MSTSPSHWFRKLLLLVLLGGAIFWLVSLDYSKHLSTNVMELLPESEQAPELTTALRIMRDRESRLLYIVLEATKGAAPTKAGIDEFVRSLRLSGQFEKVTIGRGPSQPEAIAQWVFSQRMELLFPQWLEEEKQLYASTIAESANAPSLETWLAAEVVRSINQFLESPESLALAETVPQDPLLLTSRLLKLQDTLQGTGNQNASTAVTLWAETKATALSTEGQTPVFSAMDAALRAAQQLDSGLSMNYIGLHRYGAESRTIISREISVLNIISLIVVGAIASLFVRRLTPLAHLIVIVILSMIGAWTITTMVFQPVHILSLVLGSLLCGEAIDYGLHILLHRESPAEYSYAQVLRKLGLPLCMGASTTIIGFLALLFSELPLLRQTGVFVASGLVCALTACWLYFPLWKRNTAWHRDWTGELPQPRKAWLKIGLGITLLAILTGIGRVYWVDDIRELDIKHTKLQALQLKINQAFGATGDQAAFFSLGKSPLDARDQLEIFQGLRKAHGLPPVQSLDLVLPTAKCWSEANRFRQEHPDFPNILMTELAANDYNVEAFSAFTSQWKVASTSTETLDQLYRELNTRLDGPLGNLMHCDSSGSWLLSTSKRSDANALTPPDGTFPVSQLQTLNGIFSRYRESAGRLSLYSWGLIAVLMLVVFRWPKGLSMAGIPLVAILLTGGVLGWTVHAINLFHLLGFFLGFCISMDYSIFGILARNEGKPMPISILSSALTTIAAFSVLSLSSVSAVRALGISASLVVVFAVFILYIIIPKGTRREY